MTLASTAGRLAPLLLLACTAPKADDTGVAPFDGQFTFTDANNYSYISDLAVVAQEVQLRQEVTFDWSGLTTDLLGHPIDPVTDVDLIWVVQFPTLTEDEVVAAIVTDTLLQQDVGPYIQFDNDPADATSALLSEFVFPPATPIVPEEDFTDGSGTWLVRATTGVNENRMLGFMRPTEESTNHTFLLDSASATLDFQADLQSLTGFTLAEEHAPYVANWSALDTHAGGGDLDLTDLDQLMIARYDGRTLDDLEANFIDIELIADEMYTADVYDVADYTADLSMATNADGVAFSGFGADSLWLVALRCTTVCTNPAPPFLTVVQVGAEAGGE
ncbi:MAG: hypothetical protein Q8P18_14680 [Pseudomonadota bacterium]|nr:hypothetical protein [Pseudomonadota bacterium]